MKKPTRFLPKGARMPKTLYVPESAWGRLCQLGICTSLRTAKDADPTHAGAYHCYVVAPTPRAKPVRPGVCGKVTWVDDATSHPCVLAEGHDGEHRCERGANCCRWLTPKRPRRAKQ